MTLRALLIIGERDRGDEAIIMYLIVNCGIRLVAEGLTIEISPLATKTTTNSIEGIVVEEVGEEDYVAPSSV